MRAHCARSCRASVLSPECSRAASSCRAQRAVTPAELSDAQKTALAETVDGLNAPIAALITEGNRLDLLGGAAQDLLDGAQGDVRSRLDDELADSPEDPGLVCAEARLPESTSWLEDQLTVIADLRDDVTELLGPLTVIE